MCGACVTFEIFYWGSKLITYYCDPEDPVNEVAALHLLMFESNSNTKNPAAPIHIPFNSYSAYSSDNYEWILV